MCSRGADERSGSSRRGQGAHPEGLEPVGSGSDAHRGKRHRHAPDFSRGTGRDDGVPRQAQALVVGVKALMDDPVIVTRIGDGVYRVEREGRNEIVYVTGSPDDTWAFWNGQVFRGSFAAPSPGRPHAPRGKATQSLTAPMPATVIRALV